MWIWRFVWVFGELDEFGEFSDFDEFGEFGAFVEFCDFHEVGEFYEFSSFARSLRNDETFWVKSSTVRNQAFIFTLKLLWSRMMILIDF